MNLRTKPCRALATAVVGAGIAALAVPALSSGHATVSALQPQGPPLTGARGTYVVRAPNEREAQNTWKIVMYVPAQIQESISFRQVPDWRIKIVREDTGRRGEGGSRIFAVKRVAWTAKTREAEIAPGMFGEWAIRWVNPLAPTTLCFGLLQYYRNTHGKRVKPELVSWTGDPATSDTPRSCLDVKAS
jgi:Domain of unkown function (DUF1775)